VLQIRTSVAQESDQLIDYIWR